MVTLSVVIPVKNEAENIAPLVAEIRAALESAVAYEIVYVDDGSTDETVARIRSLDDGTDRLRVIRHKASCGQSTAVRSGVKAARGRWIATLDGDGQNDPADIRPFGSWRPRNRRERGCCSPAIAPAVRIPAIKRVSSRIANRVRAFLLSDSTPDSGCGLKLFERETFLDLPYFSHMHRFLPALVLRAGGRVVSVKVNHRPRGQGVSNYGTFDRLWVGISDLAGVMWLQRRARVPVVLDETE